MSVKNFEEAIELIESKNHIDRLYWTCSPNLNIPNAYFYNSDKDFKYYPFCNDFGPVDISATYRFCQKLEMMLQNPELLNKKIYHTSSSHYSKKSNSLYLIGAFCMIFLKMTAQQLSSLFANHEVKFRDSSSGPVTYVCSLNDCFTAIEQSIRRGWFKYSEFSCKTYDFYSKLENGDMNWIIPNEFLAFSAPAKESSFIKPKNISVDKLILNLKTLGVKTVIRLNKPSYSSDKFTKEGISHYDIYLKDGSTPSQEIVDKFIDICSSSSGPVGVHCKAGLGRTGTLIGCYAIKIFKFPAASFIAWCRLCRPGCILGPQQQFLLDYEQAIKKKTFPINFATNDLSLKEENQAKNLIKAKQRRLSVYDCGLVNTSKIFEANEEAKTSKTTENHKETPPKTQKFSRLNWEITKLCNKNLKLGNSSFYAIGAKNLKSSKIFEILYGKCSD